MCDNSQDFQSLIDTRVSSIKFLCKITGNFNPFTEMKNYKFVYKSRFHVFASKSRYHGTVTFDLCNEAY